MNNLMSRKKKYKFQVDLRIEELLHVPFLNQELYVKVRLLNGGFTHHSPSLMVDNHVVRWNESFKFVTKMTANASTGELDSCICRASVRQEMRGGRSFQKLGYADVNLAQFAGLGGSNIYLLEAYDSKHRLHNSTLRVTVDMVLLSGDPCFKTQAGPGSMNTSVTETESGKTAKPPPQQTDNSGSLVSIPSLGYSSLDKKTMLTDPADTQLTDQTGHSRNSSNTSGSGYVSNASHSDKSGHVRNGSQGSAGTFSEAGSLERPNNNAAVNSSAGLHPSNNRDPRVASTREDAHHMIDKIFQDNIGSIKPEEIAETSGLHLYIREDGTASVSGHAVRRNGESKPVVIIDKR